MAARVYPKLLKDLRVLSTWVFSRVLFIEMHWVFSSNGTRLGCLVSRSSVKNIQFVAIC